VDKAASDLHDVTAGMRSSSLSDDDIRQRIAAIPPIEAHLTTILAALTPKLQDADARLAQLGPAPGPNQPAESAETAAARRSLARYRETIDSQVKQAKLMVVVADQTNKALSDALRANFETRLWARSQSVVDPNLASDLTESIPRETVRLRDIAAEEGRQIVRAARNPHSALLLILGAALGVFLLGPARILLNRLGYSRAATVTQGTPLRRSALALWLVLIAALTPFAAGIIARATLDSAGALTDDFGDVLGLAIRVITVAGFLEGVGRALLSPGRPSWRLAPLADELVARLAPYPGIIAVAAALSLFVSRVGSVLGANLAAAVAGERITVVIEIVAVGAFLITLARAGGGQATHPGARATAPRESRVPWVLAALAAWLALSAAFIAVLAGYLALAGFLMRETIWIGTVLAVLFLLLRFADDLFPAALSDRSPLGRLLRGPVGVQDHTIEHTAVLFSGVTRLFLLLLAWAAILLPFGASAGDILKRVTSTQSIFTLGQVSISPGAIFGSVGLFVLGLVATRAVRGWLEKRYLPKTRMDIGVRTSLSALFSYLGVGLALLLAFAYLGLSFSQITLFASALSVGIGFGLQSIIGNFVSGLILLVERPVKVGDWVAIGDLEGDVRAINIRATEIDMWDRSKLIVPNSELVSKTVRNVTHAGALGRVRIVLHLDASVDPEAVRTLVMGHLTAHPDILDQPAPAVFFTDVKDGNLEFTVIAYVPSPRRAFSAKSELLFQIVPDLKARGMNLASSNAVVNVGLSERFLDPNPTL